MILVPLVDAKFCRKLYFSCIIQLFLIKISIFCFPGVILSVFDENLPGFTIMDYFCKT